MRLIDADALRERFDNEVPIRPISLTYNKEDVIRALLEAPTVSGWISVKDRLPENRINVLVCLYDNRRRKISNYSDGKRMIIRIDRIISEYGEPFWAKGNTPSVIAWMPLPELPKGGESE